MMEISKKATDMIFDVTEGVRARHPKAHIWEQELKDYIATLEAENAQLKERLRWKSIEKDGLPDLQRDVLVVMIDDAIAHGYLKFADNKCVYFYFSHDPNASIEIENVILWKYDSLPEVRE